MKLDIYVNYKGNCEEAFRFYEAKLNGRITSSTVFGPVAEQNNFPGGWSNKIMHARIEIGGTVLMGADVPTAEPMRSTYLTLSFEDSADADQIYDLLVESGEVFMAMQTTNFAKRFAMLRDRFGTSWMLLNQA